MKAAISVINECPPAAALSWAFACLLLFFHKDYFKLTIDISMRKTILEMEYFYKNYDLSNAKNFQKNSFSFSRDDPKAFILL